MLQAKGSVSLLNYCTNPRFQMSVACPGCYLYFWPTGYRLKIPTTSSSLGFITLLEWLIKLRETFYLLDYWFIIKEYNSGTVRWKKMHRARHEERARDSHTLSKCTMLPKSPCVHHHGSSPKPILLGFLWWLHYIVIIDLIHWPLVIELNLQPLFPPQWSGSGAGSSNLFITWLASHAGNTFLGTLGKSPYLYNKRHLDCSPHSGNYKGFRTLCQKWGWRPNTYFWL